MRYLHPYALTAGLGEQARWLHDTVIAYLDEFAAEQERQEQWRRIWNACGCITSLTPTGKTNCRQRWRSRRADATPENGQAGTGQSAPCAQHAPQAISADN